ncbi:MAG: hypothetical protein JWO46_10 [Nocardioidaceae bacterium]|nr:hypothetical protein [Nocardioidaceae bacterium]
MLKKSVVLAAALLLASGGAVQAAKPPVIDPASLPQGAPATIAYHAEGTGIVTPSGTIATPLTTTSGSAGLVDGRYVVVTGHTTDTQTGAVGTIYHLVDQAGNATRVGGVYSQLDHGTTKIGNGFAAMTLDYTTKTDAPMALLNLRTGQEFRHENRAYLAVVYFQPAPGGVPFTAYTGKKRGSRTVLKWRADGSIHRLFRLPKHRAAQYVDITRNLVVSSGKKRRTLVSTVRKPAKVRWSTAFTQVKAISPNGKRVLMGRGNTTLDVRRLRDGKLLHRFTFTTSQHGEAAFEDNNTFLMATPANGNQPDLLIRCRLSGSCEKVAGPANYYAFN